MTKVKPFIKCVDYWPEQIPPEKLRAYKLLIQAGLIIKHHVIHSRKEDTTAVEYFSTIPHEWILEELKKAAAQPTCEQIAMDDERR
jgi:hypothetical protein